MRPLIIPCVRHIGWGTRRRGVVPIIVGLLMLVVVTGCGASEPGTGRPASSSSSTPPATPAAAGGQWAESVCSAADDVRSTLDAVGSGITFSPTAGENAREQVKSTLNAQVAAARTSITALGATLHAIPVDADGRTN